MYYESGTAILRTECPAYDTSSWDKDTYGRKIVDSLEDSSKKKDKYEEYIFVVRRQYGAHWYSRYTQPVLTLN